MNSSLHLVNPHQVSRYVKTDDGFIEQRGIISRLDKLGAKVILAGIYIKVNSMLRMRLETGVCCNGQWKAEPDTPAKVPITGTAPYML